MSVAKVRQGSQVPLQGSQEQVKLQDVGLSATHQGAAPFPMGLRESQTTEPLQRGMVSSRRRVCLRCSQDSCGLGTGVDFSKNALSIKKMWPDNF